MIGIVGGIGSYAGLDLARNVFDNTLAQTDQEHLPLAMISVPATIADRTEYLFGHVAENPALAIVEVLLKLEQAGATVAGIPCNTAHARQIYSQITETLTESNSSLVLLSLVEETVKTIITDFLQYESIGVLSTTGTYRFGIYSEPLEKAGLKPVVPDKAFQEDIVHPSIYCRDYGIKAQSTPVTQRARADLLEAIDHLRQKGAELIIKGCTEIALAIPEQEISGIPLLDPSIILARRLVSHIDSSKLKPLPIF